MPGFTQRRNYCEWVESLLEKDGVRLRKITYAEWTLEQVRRRYLPCCSPRDIQSGDMFGTDITKEAVERSKELFSSGRERSVPVTIRLDKSTATIVVIAVVKVEEELAYGTFRKRRTSVTEKVLTEDQNDNRTRRRNRGGTHPRSHLFDEEHIDFTVCNPPFFNSMSEIPPKIQERISAARELKIVVEGVNLVSSGDDPRSLAG